MIRVRVYGPRTLRDSGLSLYSSSLRACLEFDARFKVDQVGWDEDSPGFDGLDAVIWCGFPKDIGHARRILDLMVTVPRDLAQVLLPEWEETPTSDLVRLTAGLRDRRLLVIGLNNSAIAPQLTASSDRWVSAYVPTPLDEGALAKGAMPRPPRGPEHRLNAIYLGRDTPRKRLRTLLDAWRLPAVRSVSNLTVYVSGQFDPGSANDAVKFVAISSEEPTPERFRWYEEGDIFVSASSFEQGPIAAVVAMARGCVPVLADSPGHRDLAARSECCILFGDLEDLSCSVVGLHDDQEELRRLSERGISYAQREHSQARVADAILNLIKLW